MRRDRLAEILGVSLIVCAFLVLVGTVPATAASSRFLVTDHHTKEECLKALDDVKAVGTKLLSKCDWGCMAGDHTGYVIVEAKDETAVRKLIPASWSGAKIVKLNKFTPEQIESFHKSMK